MNVIEMAPRTAMRCKEKHDERAEGPVERFDTAYRSRSRVPSGYGRLARLQRCKLLKTGRFPASSRLASEHVGSDHFNQINEF